MKIKIISLVAAMGLAVSACASYPTSSVNQGAADAGIWVSRAPAGALVLVAGQVVGPAIDYADNKHVISLEPGRHEVEIVNSDGQVISRQVVVLSAGAKYEVRAR